jgi:tRNA(Ile)-lysidine synthase
MTLTDRVREKIEREDLIPRGGHVVVGFSGGPDSACLFDVLLGLRGALDYTMSAVHVNHRLRSVESDEDQWYVETLCEERGVPLIVKAYDVADLAELRGQSVEEAGRDARYEAFFEAAAKAAAKRGLGSDMVRIALAHNKGDLSETVLMRLIRGTGPDGLAAISAVRRGQGGYDIVRPLIAIPREDIEAYCAENGLAPRADSTNAKTDYLRNSIRLELLPMLREKYNPSVDGALARLSRAAAESRDYFESVVSGMIESDCEFAGSGAGVRSADFGAAAAAVDTVGARLGGAGRPSYAELPLDLLRTSHPAIRHRLIVAVFAKIGLRQDIASAHLAAADALIRSGRTGKHSDFPGGYSFGISYEKAIFVAPDGADDAPDESGAPGEDGADLCASCSYTISLADIAEAGGRVTIFEGSPLPLEAGVADYDGAAKSARSLVLDYDALSAAALLLRLRPKAPGDRICLPGMSGSKKLQDIFVDEKIPREKRAALLVVATEDEVLWIPGLRRSRLYEPGPATKRVLILTPED